MLKKDLTKGGLSEIFYKSMPRLMQVGFIRLGRMIIEDKLNALYQIKMIPKIDFK